MINLENNFIKQNINNIYNPISFNDVVQNKTNTIHNTLFNDALNRYICYTAYNMSYSYNLSYSYNTIYNYNDIYEHCINDLITSYKWVERIVNNDYIMPSYVLQIYRKKPFNKKLIDLTKYWNNEYIIKQKSNNDIIKDKENNELLTISEIEYYDYIKEKVQLGNKENDDKITIKFSELNEKIKPNKNLFFK
jgi:hypothetical protein